MHTLHEFFDATESVSYLVAAICLIAFAYFFMYVFGDPKKGN